MRLLFICPEPIEKGGIGTYTYNMISGFLSLNHKNIDITLLLRNEKKKNIFEKRNNRLELLTIHGGLIDWYKEVTKFLLKNYMEFDLIEAPEFTGTPYFACKLSREVRNRLVIRLHTNTWLIKHFEQKYGIVEGIKTKIMDYIEKYVTSNAKLITAPSKTIAKIECSRWKIPIEEVRIIPNPIKLPIDVSEKNILKEEFNISNYVLFFGRLQIRKGIFDFIDSIKYVKNEISFVVVGSDPFDLKHQLINKLPDSLRDKIRFIIEHLPRDKIMRIVKDAKAVILPSHFENFPYALVETMGLGVPVITTRVGGIVEIACHLNNCFLVKPGHPRDIAKWVDYIFNEKNSTVIAKIRRNALNTAYSFEAIKIAQRYLNMLGGL